MALIFKNPKLPTYKLPKVSGRGSLVSLKTPKHKTPKIQATLKGIIKNSKPISISKFTKLKTPKTTKITILKRAVKKAKNVFS